LLRALTGRGFQTTAANKTAAFPVSTRFFQQPVSALMAKILYFATLVDKLGTASEEITLDATISDVRALLALLRTRGKHWEAALTEDKVRITVNRQFAAPETTISNTAEIALVPMRLF
jgi:molybdopterin synthase sulfur carrier subunit